MSPVTSPSAVTNGRFDTSQFSHAPQDAKEVMTNLSIDEVAAYKRGIDWLNREMPSLQTFARVVTGRESIVVRVGPISCTDGRDIIYVQPQRIAVGEDPGPRHMAHLYHEMAHALESQVFEPAESRKPEHALKTKAIKDYGRPADHVWNGLEDGRVEELLYKKTPGARKHIIVDVVTAGPPIVESIAKTGKRFAIEHLAKTGDKSGAREMANVLKVKFDTGMPYDEFLIEVGKIESHLKVTGDWEAAVKVERQTVGDMGLLMASYLYTAGYEEQARAFGPEVSNALDDPQLRTVMDVVHSKTSSVSVLRESVPEFITRAKELGFFVDYDDRGMNPVTREPEVIDWNDLTKAEQDALRESVKNKTHEESDSSVIVVNAPKDLIDEAEANREKSNKPNDSKQESGGTSDSETDGDSSESEEDDEELAGDTDRSDRSGSPADGESNSDGDSSPGSANPSDGDPSEGAGADASEGAKSGSDEDAAAAEPNAGLGDESSADEASSESMAGSMETASTIGEESASDSSAGGDASIEESTDPNYESLPSDETDDESESLDEDAESTESKNLSVEEEAAEAEITELAKQRHAELEDARVDRVKNFKEKYDQIEEMIRPPHAEYTTHKEALKQERADPVAQTIKAAINMEVGEISGAPENRFLFTETTITQGDSSRAPQLATYSDVIAGEVNRLRAVFKQNEKSSFDGRYEIGTHIKSSSLPGFMLGEHMKPFDRRIKPKKKSYAVTLLVDQSGSMAGSKIEIARYSLCLQAHLLDQLQIPFEVLGFSTVSAAGYGYWDGKNYAVKHDVFKSFDQPWNSDQRNKVLAINTHSSNLDGLALSWAWNRLKKRREEVKILMSYSDGQPNPDTDNQIRIMKHVLRQMQIAKAIGIGVGIQSYATTALYPVSVYCDDARSLPRLVTKTLEEQLKKKR